MSQLNNLVVGVVALSPDKELVGRIRLQKVLYLLDQLGMEAGIPFEYHHYGPYSEAISDAVTDAKFWGEIDEIVKFRQSDGAPYSSFKTTIDPPDKLGHLSKERAQEYLKKFSECTSTVLELAATAHWLKESEEIDDWRKEISVRKSDKIGKGNLDKGVDLLNELGFQLK